MEDNKEQQGCLFDKDTLSKLIFSPNIIEQYNCEDWVIALLRDLDRKLSIVMWNINQEQYDSPFSNTGNEYIGKNFEVHAYNWGENANQYFNFKCGAIEISWYKYLGRDTTINGIYAISDIIDMYHICLRELEELEGEYFATSQ